MFKRIERRIKSAQNRNELNTTSKNTGEINPRLAKEDYKSNPYLNNVYIKKK